MTSQKNLKLVIGAMFTALCFICTVFIPIPSIKGYTNLGDGMVILSGILLGPLYGGMAAGIGSMFADLFLGYTSYAIATLLIKSTAAIAAWLIYKGVSNITKKPLIRVISVSLGGIGTGIVVTSCYFLYDMSVMGLGMSAAAGIPGNLVQNFFGILISTIMFPVLYRIPTVRNFSQSIYPAERKVRMK